MNRQQRIVYRRYKKELRLSRGMYLRLMLIGFVAGLAVLMGTV